MLYARGERDPQPTHELSRGGGPGYVLPHPITNCLTAWRLHSVLQHACSNHLEDIPANDAIRGSAQIRPVGSWDVSEALQETDTNLAPCVA